MYHPYPLQPGFTTPPQHEVYRHAKAGNISKVKYWLEEQNFPIDKQDYYSNTVLYYGCLCNHPDLVLFLMDRGATFQRRTPDGRRTYLASSNQIIRNILLGRRIDGTEHESNTYVERWFADGLQNSFLSDVSFVVKGGKSFHAHKAIIAARCPNLIPKLENKDTVTFGAAISEAMISNLLSYIYTEKIDDEDHTTLGKMASKLGLKGLELLCAGHKEIDPNYSISNVMKAFVNSDLFSDITLTTPDGGCIPCHKVILSSRCDYFKAFLSMKWADNGSNELYLNEITKDVLANIVQYIYSGTFEVNSENVWDTLVAANQFLLPGLQRKLELEVLKNYLDVDSCIELAMAAEMLNNDKVFKASVRVAANNYATLSLTPLFLSLPPSIQNAIHDIRFPKK